MNGLELATEKYEEFENQYGHFSSDGYEYIITHPDTPRPWTNVISNGDFGFIISQAGGGFTWRTHANLNRLTRWNQDLIRDNWGKWLYLRDLDTNELRSLAYQPVQANYDQYRVRHGLGYSVFEQRFGSIETSWTLFAAKDDPVEIWICRLRNTGQEFRRFQLTSYLEWNLGAGPDNHREFHKLFITTEYDPENSTILAAKNIWEIPSNRGHWNTDWQYLGFHSVNTAVSGWDASKENLIGRYGDFHRPQGIGAGTFARKSGRFEDAAASLAVDIELPPGGEKNVVFLLGQPDKDDSKPLSPQIQPYIEKYNTVERAVAELKRVKAFWRELTSRVWVHTPDASFNLLTNIWLKYQVFSGHLWARAGYYQQSGAYGFRDQLQSSQVWLTHQPSEMLEQIKLHARHQFQKGTVLHWWHPLSDVGLETEMTDDLLWLPFMLQRFFREVGRYDALIEVVPFYDGGEDTLQEHCIRAIEVVLRRFSKRGLPLIGAGDWCDGFSAVGLNWKGESIWLGMFLYDILTQWADILETKSPIPQPQIAHHYRKRAEDLKEALDKHGWNGQWYIGATKDDGTPLGDPSQEENKIYLNSQTWAIISGVANENRRDQIARAMLEHLEGDNGMMLFQPAYRKADPFIGYITRYAPGVRENGGVYTHAATWSVLAFAMLHRAEDAYRLFRKLNPICQTGKDVERYLAEPYVLPGNIEGKDSPYYGRAGWTWYTGSAGWLFTIALEAICGVRPEEKGLQLVPCFPPAWQEIKVNRRFRNALYHITFRNPHGKCGGVKEFELNGILYPGNVVPPQPEGEYDVVAILTGE